MAELGSGGGSDYPSSLDTDTIKEVDNSTLARADVPNDSNAAIVAIENELGTNPSGAASDVAAYLDSYVLKTSGTELLVKIVDIGDWDMDADASISVAHGLTLANIRSVTGIIRDDTKAKYWVIAPDHSTAAPAAVALGNMATNDPAVDATNINIYRLAGDIFDTAAYDDVGGAQETRGWITITYAA
jgi:hypothetical protein